MLRARASLDYQLSTLMAYCSSRHQTTLLLRHGLVRGCLLEPHRPRIGPFAQFPTDLSMPGQCYVHHGAHPRLTLTCKKHSRKRYLSKVIEHCVPQWRMLPLYAASP